MNGRRRFDDRTDDQKVSDALDRLTDRRFELEAAIRSMLTAWDAYIDDDEFDPLVDAVAALRALVPSVGTHRAFEAEAKLRHVREAIDLGQAQVREMLDVWTDERGTYSHSAAMRMNIRYAETLTAIRTILDR